MKSVSLLVTRLLPILLLVLGFSIRGNAQAWNLPHCSGNSAGKIYYVVSGTNEIVVMDPLNPTAARPTGIFIPSGASALAIGLLPPGSTGPNPTYYSTQNIGGTVMLVFWDGSGWISTNVGMSVDNLAGSCGNIFGYDCKGGFIFKWTVAPVASPGNAVASFAPTGVCDISGDCGGGYWTLTTGGGSPALRHFNWPSGNPVNDRTYSLLGTFTAGNDGLAVIDNRVYYDGVNGRLYTGVLNNTLLTATFTQSQTTPFGISPALDFASCGLEGACSNKGSRDTVYACTSNNDANVTLRATGSGPYQWTVIAGGPATIATNGNSATITTRANTTVTYRDANCGGVNNIIDTTDIIINNAVIDAGPDKVVIGCKGVFIDTLRGTIRDTTTGLFYAYDWTPLTGLIQGNTTLDSAIIQPRACTRYYLTVTANTGCTWKDSVNICVADSTPVPRFVWFANLGCDEDTVRFVNTTSTSVYTNYTHWAFGDTTYSFETSPTHIYEDQGIYTVTLTMSNQYCTDSFKANVNILHTLDARFTVPATSICANSQIRFTDASTFPRDPNGIGDPVYFYNFGDGSTSTLSSPTHTFTVPGTYLVRMRIQDYLGCIDSFQQTIVVDTLPYATFTTPDTLICQGAAVNLFADYSSVGGTGTTFDMGDGTEFNDVDTVRYSYQNPGTYTINFIANYRICPQATFTRTVIVSPFPGAYIGEDTVLCPNGAPIALSERLNVSNRNARYRWSTGDTSIAIQARDIGTYWVRVTVDGCTATDSLTVNKDCYVDIPNIFSPNGDRTNDYFYPRQFLSRSVSSFKMSIFNRWGQAIFESTALDGRGWDGRFNDKDQPQGVYIYVIDVSFDNGVKEHYTGNVTLIR